ncbi:MAG: hypothetical protein Kow0010_05890 [Dehalococcoidia bacterium]
MRWRIRLRFARFALATTAGLIALPGVLLFASNERLSTPVGLFTLTAGIAIGGLAASVLIAGYATRRLTRATDALQKMANGTLDLRLPGARIREFDDLSHTVNSMATNMEETRRRLLHQAFHDRLTGLPNRAMFMSKLEAALGNALLGGSVAVLFVDLDRFKFINDTLGHQVGDTLLTIVSRRLLSAAGPDCTVARLGGDEFTILIESPRAEQRALEVAEAVTERMLSPFKVAGHELFATASVGVAVNTLHVHSITELLRQADIALYRAKAEGKARFVLFKPALDALTIDDVDLDSALRRALQRDQLRVHYQPEVDLTSGAVVGMEALLRWDHPHRGVLSPDEFIAIAEETGEIVNIGSWVLEQACTQVAAMSARAVAAPVVSVNISASEFRHANLAHRVARVLDRTGMPPPRLRLELTESVLMEDIPASVETLTELRRVGVRLAIDDFGTGYSSLSYLRSLPVDTLKVDRAFVGDIGRDRRSNAVVQAVIELGRALSMEVTAEGIESLEQLRFLRAAGCRLGQGHYFSPAVDVHEMERLLRQSSRRGGSLYRVA